MEYLGWFSALVYNEGSIYEELNASYGSLCVIYDRGEYRVWRVV